MNRLVRQQIPMLNHLIIIILYRRCHCTAIPSNSTPYSSFMSILSKSAVGSQDDVSLVRILASKTGDNNAHGVNRSTSEDNPSDDRNEASKWLEQAAVLLNHQWPRGGSTDAYKEKVINEQPQLSNRDLPIFYDNDDDSDDDFSSSSSSFYGLPSSYLLIQNGNDCIG